ncbi:MAG: MiaB/RimO family radical SAM methylthiotransferase [Candidatus Omnitrophica bacterium]|nr:MiaB/RimO family radical SAM methylthiotransferase [Candidatus Omnitrophota bacterium]MDD5661135.1 MiaB/RimO family radical SAM methylthiotransferase [Candidatus Omnitrophota bacterium]
MNPAPSKSRTVKFFTLGCKANQYDTQSIRERFLSKGFREYFGYKLPDCFLVNTCTVTAGADQKSRNIIRRCIHANPKAKVIVTGCLVENDWQSLMEIKGIGLIIKKSFFPEGISSFSQHARAFLKIQDGCSNFCTYCKVALVRGRQRSKKLPKIILEAEKLVACGYKEIVLTGICLGAYGDDLYPKKSLIDVVDSLEKITGLLRIRLSSIEAGDLSPSLVKRLETSRKFCRHMHIPIQSGDDLILKMMNRKYTRRKYIDLITGLKRKIPHLSITTDCLVGFPGETEENFRNTAELIKEIKPLKVHIFPYSKREGTAAAKFGGSVKPEIISARCKQLEDIAYDCRINFMRKFLSKQAYVLIECRSKSDPDFWEGLTDNYLPVKLAFKPGLMNKVVRVALRRMDQDCLIGEYIDNSKIKCRIKL